MSRELEVRARNVRILPRTQDITPTGLDVGMQVWRDVNRNQLLARFASARDKGYVTKVAPIRATRQREFVMIVKVLREPPSRTPWYVTAVVVSMGAAATIGFAAWHARYILLSVAGAMIALPLLYWAVSHFRVCPGLHCPCCKNG